MAAIIKRSANPVADLLGWLETESAAMRSFGTAPYIRVEDFVEDGNYVVRAEMPGVDPNKDIQIDIAGDVMTIRGERREEEHDRNRSELHYGSFERTLPLPAGVKAEEVRATYINGVLEVRVPYAVEEPKTTRVAIEHNGS
ncbi:Hsp20/alpha crystallin family protein [Nocardioides sp. NPDC000445]|uniref:Hsp20/alpha crystallin family protein n=1 Tax=Nocardioides sp. NPDC000445 TaxID=3154257 RepID=UPI00332482EC